MRLSLLICLFLLGCAHEQVSSPPSNPVIILDPWDPQTQTARVKVSLAELSESEALAKALELLNDKCTPMQPVVLSTLDKDFLSDTPRSVKSGRLRIMTKGYVTYRFFNLGCGAKLTTS